MSTDAENFARGMLTDEAEGLIDGLCDLYKALPIKQVDKALSSAVFVVTFTLRSSEREAVYARVDEAKRVGRQNREEQLIRLAAQCELAENHSTED